MPRSLRRSAARTSSAFSTSLLRAILILDLKFPCPEDREPIWTYYGDKSAYSGSSQNKVYMVDSKSSMVSSCVSLFRASIRRSIRRSGKTWAVGFAASAYEHVFDDSW